MYCIYCMKEKDENENVCPHCKKRQDTYECEPHFIKPGTELREKYIVGAVLGSGGFGITYIGCDKLFGDIVAIKEFYPTGMVTRNSEVSNTVRSVSSKSASDYFSDSKEIFWREAKTLAGFRGEPGIVSVLDFFTENNTAYIVTEFLEGESLKDYIARVGRLSYINTLCLLMPVMDSLEKIHKKHLIHRDISPDNIMLVGESVKLIDFGATRQYADNHSLSIVLKHGYAPLEQYSSRGNQGVWTDVYALCATMYMCMTGEVPMPATDRVITHEELKRPSEFGIDVPKYFEDALMKGLALEPSDRVQSIVELKELLTDEPKPEPELEPEKQPEPEPEPIPEPEPAPEPEKPQEQKPVVSQNVNNERLSVYQPPVDKKKSVVPQKPESVSNKVSKAQERLSEYVGKIETSKTDNSKKIEKATEQDTKTPKKTKQKPKRKHTAAIVTCIVCSLILIGTKVIFFSDFSIKDFSHDFSMNAKFTYYNLTKKICIYKDDNEKWILNKDTLTITGSGLVDYHYKKYEWYRKNYINSIVIENGITIIDDGVFSGCYSVKSITIPDSVTSIGDSAFWRCENLTSITIPDSVTSIGYSAFRGCENLTSITIPDSVTSIGALAFKGCSSLTSITIPDSVTSIGIFAVGECPNLTIYCPSGSYAEQYAKDHYIPYELI